MIINELLLIFSAHALEWVESTLKVSFKCFTSLNNFIHDV
jgi:hypothetical protein